MLYSVCFFVFSKIKQGENQERSAEKKSVGTHPKK